MEESMAKMVVEDVLREKPAQSDADFVLVSLRPDETLASALRKLHGSLALLPSRVSTCPTVFLSICSCFENVHSHRVCI